MITKHTVDITLNMAEVLQPLITHLNSLGNITSLTLTTRNGQTVQLPTYNLLDGGTLDCKIVKYEHGAKLPETVVAAQQTDAARNIQLIL